MGTLPNFIWNGELYLLSFESIRWLRSMPLLTLTWAQSLSELCKGTIRNCTFSQITTGMVHVKLHETCLSQCFKGYISLSLFVFASCYPWLCLKSNVVHVLQPGDQCRLFPFCTRTTPLCQWVTHQKFSSSIFTISTRYIKATYCLLVMSFSTVTMQLWCESSSHYPISSPKHHMWHYTIGYITFLTVSATRFVKDKPWKFTISILTMAIFNSTFPFL